jgi:hypothetical protein
MKESILRNSVFAFIAIPIIGWAIYLIVALFAAAQILSGSAGRIGDGLGSTIVVEDRDLSTA